MSKLLQDEKVAALVAKEVEKARAAERKQALAAVKKIQAAVKSNDTLSKDCVKAAKMYLDAVVIEIKSPVAA